MTLNPHRRLRSETVDLTVPLGEGFHHLTVSLAVDSNHNLRELVFVRRPGRVGDPLDDMFRELGIRLSRIIQGRSPDGEPTELPVER